METFTLGVALFTVIVLALVAIIMAARSKLVSTGNVNITINGEKTISVPAGGKLLQTLAAEKLFVPSACGGAAPVRSAGCGCIRGRIDPANRRKPYHET